MDTLNLQRGKPRIRQTLQQAIGRIDDLLSALHIDDIQVSDYAKEYLTCLIRAKPFVLQTYAHLIELAASPGFEETCIVDYGGGTGLLSLLAKTAGIQEVIYVDINPKSYECARTLGQLSGAAADTYLCGDVDCLAKHLAGKRRSRLAICSFDVIEHIYDIDSFVKQTSSLNAESLSLAMASTANPKNPWVCRKLANCHRQHERWDDPEGYVARRRAIIKEANPQLSENSLDSLAVKTRGLRKEDILKAVERHLKHGEEIHPSPHPTNTCSPDNGNWAERLHDLDHLVALLHESGISAGILPGHWVVYGSFTKRLIKRILNRVIMVLGTNALWAAPYYILKGQRESP